MCNLDKLRVSKKPFPLPESYDKIWLKVRKIVDRLHMRNHKNPDCRVKYGSDDMKEKFPSLNTPVAEQVFVWASLFKRIMCAMPKQRSLFSLSQNGNSAKQLRNELLQKEKGTRISIDPLSNMTTTQFVIATADSKVPVKRAYNFHCYKYKSNKGSFVIKAIAFKNINNRLVALSALSAAAFETFLKIGYVFRTDKMPRAGVWYIPNILCLYMDFSFHF